MMLSTFTLLAAYLVPLLPLCSPATSDVFGYNNIIKRVRLRSKPVEDLVGEMKYPLESHIITSADGYVLTYHRVPQASAEVEASRSTTAHRYPILLVHGILQSSAFFLALKDGLAYKLADAGFDVWLANHRGNPYSKAHLHLNSRMNPHYWDFSFNEMGRYDLPAAVDYILYTTKKPSLSYVGFSMGTTMFWTFAHWWPDYMSKVDCMTGIAPIAIPSALKIVMNRSSYGIVTTVLKTLNVLHFFEFRPYHRQQAIFVRVPCTAGGAMFKFICKRILKIVCYLSGMQENLLDYTATIGSLNFMSAGTSIQSLFHLLQAGSAGEFQMYDYGDHKNMRYYGGFTTPPKYDLSRVTIPVYLIQGGKDEYSVKDDTERLIKELRKHGEVKLLFEEEAANYNHLDFFFSHEANQKLHIPLVDVLNEVVSRTLELRKTQG